jgi:hypothetical protein
VDLHYSVIGNPLIYWVNSIIGSLMIIIISKSFLNKFRFLSFIGKNSLIIMATHLPLPVIGICTKLIGYLPIENAYIIFSAKFVLVMAIEMVIVVVINNYMRFLIDIDSFKKLKRKKVG